jgi:cystathionine beta-lyase/cystathionine gamma-synthase
MSGFVGMPAFDMKGGLSAARRFGDKIRIFPLAASLGEIESLIVPPIYTSLPDEHSGTGNRRGWARHRSHVDWT